MLLHSGSGASDTITTVFRDTVGHQPDPHHRVNNLPALQTLCFLGPAASNAPGANIQVAFVPVQAAAAIGVHTVEPGGSEAVFFDTQFYALSEYSKLQRTNPIWLRPGPWLEMLLNEAFHMDTAIRLLQFRPLLTCEDWRFAATKDTSPPATPPGPSAEQFNLLA